MANLLLRREKSPATITNTPPTHWDPFQRMRELLRFDPFTEAFTPTPLTFVPAFEVKETKDAYVFRADLPGVREADLDINLTGDRLTVSGKREAEQEDTGDTWYTLERSYGSFMRSFTLPEGVDAEHARAELNAGVLTLVLPKRPEAQPKKIPLKVEKTKA